jgi:multiple sugar transport system permease protein
MTIIPSPGRRTALAVRMIVLLAFAVFFVVPLAWLVLAPTKTDYQLLTESPFAVGSFHNVWIAWEQLNGFSNHIYRRWMENSLLYSLSAIAITLATAIPAGYGLAFGSFRGRKLILKLTLVAMLMPASTLVLPLFLELNALRLIGSIFSIILPFSFFPFGVYLAYIYYSTALPAGLLNAARVDGCSEWATFRHIGMPLARPVVALVFFFSFVANWTNFFLPYAFLADDRQLPIQVGLSDIFRSTRPAVALAALIAALPIAIVFVVSQRALVRGLVGGATKGERSRLRTEVISPSPSSRANRSASRRSVFTLSAAGLIFDGAATTQLIPAPAHARASRYPVGPARANLRSEAPALHTVWPMRRCRPSASRRATVRRQARRPSRPVVKQVEWLGA